MIKVENRESAHLKSRVFDKSAVPNIESFNGLFAAITPIAKAAPNEEGLFDPILIRDTDSLIANFGDPRIDPEKYIDLYSIMQLVGNGGTCYVAKVPSGNTGTYAWETEPENLSNESRIALSTTDTNRKIWVSGEVDNKYDILRLAKTTVTVQDEQEVEGDPTLIERDKFEVSIATAANDKFIYTITLKDSAVAVGNDDRLHIIKVADAALAMTAISSMSEPINVAVTLSQSKPLSLKAYYLNVEVSNTVNGNANKLASAKVKLEKTTTNKGLVNSLNSAIGTYLSFELNDKSTENACEQVDSGVNSIVKKILDKHAAYPELPAEQVRANLSTPAGISLTADYIAVLDTPSFSVPLENYVKTLQQFKAKKYTGCIMSDLTSPMNYPSSGVATSFGVPSFEDRRSLHYNLKDIARERKDTNVILSVPYKANCTSNTPYTLDEICDWTASQKDFSELWEYGQTNTSDYAEQSFYLEMYASWLEWQCSKIVNGNAGSTKVITAPSNLVVNNILTSYRERGVQFPVAGDFYGTLPESCRVLLNPKTKIERDQLVQYRINPIYDTGTRGIQIYGNETLNAGYTDLNAAHIARTLVYIRSTVDEYTEKLKFSINSPTLWDTWNNYVSHVILDPLVSANGLAEYVTTMDDTTTSGADMANRTVRGKIELRFYQSAEIFDLSYVVYSSSTTIEEARASGV